MKKIYTGIIIFLALLMGLGFYGFYLHNNLPEANAGLADGTRDVIGTKVGTSTTGVFFQNNNASTTYSIWVGGEYDTAVFTFWIKSASTTAQGGANLTFYVLASNDTDCKTSSTTTGTLNPILMKDINWFDAAPFLDGHAAQTLPNSTSTNIFNTSGGSGTGRQLLLTNLNVQCLALWVSGSSTIVWSQVRLKDNN
jgi:hypothetical protein